MTEHDRFARRRLHHAAENLKGGSFAGAVWSNQTENLAALDVEIDAAHGFNVAVNFAQTANMNREFVLYWERGRLARIWVTRRDYFRGNGFHWWQSGRGAR